MLSLKTPIPASLAYPTNILFLCQDFNWHAMFHRWLELAFTPCGDLLPELSSRDPWPEYGHPHLHVCPEVSKSSDP